MVPLAYHDQHFVHLDNSQQQATNKSSVHQHTCDKLNQPSIRRVAKEQSQNTVTVPPSSFNKKAQSFSVLPAPKSKVTQGSCNRAMKSSSLHSKCPATPSKDPHLKSSLHPSWKPSDSSFSYRKPQTMGSSRFTNASSLEPSQIAPKSRLPLPKPETSSSIDVSRKSHLLEPTERVSASSSVLQHQETLNIIWTSSSLESSQSDPTLYKSKSQKESSLDPLWSSLLDPNQKAVSSPPFKNKLQRNGIPPTSSSLESNRMAQNSPLPDYKSLKVPLSNSNNNVGSLPLSQVKSRKSPTVSPSVHPSQSLPTYQPKPKTVARSDQSMRATLSSPVSHSKFQNTTSPNDKHRALQLSPVHPKPNISGQRVSSPKPCIRNKSSSVLSPRVQSKGSIEHSVKPEPENDIPWSLDYSHPCIIKGGTVPVDVVNKIVNSISKSTIQKDLSRQILFRRMRGRPNPRPGPRLSSTYAVCLECASYIKSQCDHLTGKKDPRCATLFVIPTPESNSDGKVNVKLVLILSLPETASSSCFQLPLKDAQPEDNLEAHDDNLEELEKITQFFPASESDFIQGFKANRKWLAVSSENKDISQEPQAVDWLLYVKNSSNIQTQTQVPHRSSSSSSSSCSYSSSSSSSSTGFPSPPSPCKTCIRSPPFSSLSPYLPSPPVISPPSSGYPLTKVRSHHRLPPGVSWLEFIRGPTSENTKIRQSATPKTKHVRTHTSHSMKKGKRGSNPLLKYFQTKFQNEKS